MRLQIMKFFSIFLITVMCISSHAIAETAVFKEIEKIPLHLESEIFFNIGSVVEVPSGYIIQLFESEYSSSSYLVKTDKNGKMTAKYNTKGYGPGNLNKITSILATDSSIMVSEMINSYVHEYDHNLVFKQDHRVKRGGRLLNLGKYWGIPSVTEKKINGKDKKYLLSLYDKKTFQFVKHAYEIDNIPHMLGNNGCVSRVNDNLWIGVYVNVYQIAEFDGDMNFKRNILSSVPAHIKEYYPWEGSTTEANADTFKWQDSWAIMSSVYCINQKYWVLYRYQHSLWFDIYSMDGKPLLLNQKLDKGMVDIQPENAYLLKRLEKVIDDEHSEFWLIKEKIIF